MVTEWLVDTNVLIDVIHDDLVFAEVSVVAGFGLISRDEGYAKYFKLELLNPANDESL